MGLIVDSNVFIESERRQGAVDLSPWKDRGPVFLSAVTMSELLVGVHRSNSPERKARRSAFVEAILGAIPILPVDEQVARVHAEQFAELLSRGQMIGAHDLWIAATAVAHGHAVLRNNVAEFSRVSGLEVLPFVMA